MPESEDALRKRHWTEAQNRLAPGETALDRLLDDMTWPSEWHRVRGEDGRVSVILPNVPNHRSGTPEAMALEDEWEAKSIACHEAQVPVTLPDKPALSVSPKYGSAVAEFQIDQGSAPTVKRQLRVPKFHESPASTETQRRTKRSD